MAASAHCRALSSAMASTRRQDLSAFVSPGSLSSLEAKSAQKSFHLRKLPWNDGSLSVMVEGLDADEGAVLDFSVSEELTLDDRSC